MAQKNEASFVVDLERPFASLNTREKSGGRRIGLKIFKQIAAGNEVIELNEINMVDEKIYADNHNSNRGLVESVDPFLEALKPGRAKSLIKHVQTTHTSRKIFINTAVDYQESVRGFNLIPDYFLESWFAYAGEKVCDIIGVGFLCAKKKKNLNSVARTYRFRVYGREVQKILGWPVKVKYSVKKSLGKAINKINEYSALTGISVRLVEPQGYRVRMEKYLDEAYLEFCFSPEFAKNYLAAFGMEPAVQKPEAPEIIPAIPEPAVEAQQLNFSSNEAESMNREEIATMLEKIASVIRSNKF